MKYLGLIVDGKLVYKEHIKSTAEKAEKIMTSLGQLLPNISGLKQARSRFLCSVIHTVLLYGAPV